MRVFARYAARLSVALCCALIPAGPARADSVSVSATVPELVVGGLECIPQPFDPTSDLLTTGFTLSRPCSVMIMFTDPLGSMVKMIPLPDSPAGVASVTWDGRDTAGSLVPPTWYLCSVSATIFGTPMQTSATHVVAVSHGAPLTMKTRGAKPRPFSPPGTTDVVVVLSRDAMVSVTIRTSSGKVVRNEPTRLWFAGTNTYTWDGLDNGGKLEPNGTYYCTFSGVDSGGNSAEVTQEVIRKKTGK